jgi:hypothetical protein
MVLNSLSNDFLLHFPCTDAVVVEFLQLSSTLQSFSPTSLSLHCLLTFSVDELLDASLILSSTIKLLVM